MGPLCLCTIFNTMKWLLGDIQQSDGDQSHKLILYSLPKNCDVATCKVSHALCTSYLECGLIPVSERTRIVYRALVAGLHEY